MQCSHYNANMWYDERISKRVSTTNPTFNLCCGGGKVELPLLQNTPKYLSTNFCMIMIHLIVKITNKTQGHMAK